MKDILEFKDKWAKYSNLKNFSYEQIEEAIRELEPYLNKLDLVKKCFAEQEKISFTYYLQKPIKLDTWNKGFREEWKQEYPDRIDEHDEEANKELDDLIGKVDTLGKYSSRDRSEEWYNTIPITYSVDMDDRRAITFYFRDVEEGFRSCCSALGLKSVREFSRSFSQVQVNPKK
jgi:hypothetical protein